VIKARGATKVKESTVGADQELVLTRPMLREAGLQGRLRLIIGQGEIRICSGTATEAEKVLQELAGCLGHEPAIEYDMHLDLGGLYEAR
jgi:hypothetical protein